VECDIYLDEDTVTISPPAEPDHDYAYTLRLADVPNPQEG